MLKATPRAEFPHASFKKQGHAQRPVGRNRPGKHLIRMARNLSCKFRRTSCRFRPGGARVSAGSRTAHSAGLCRIAPPGPQLHAGRARQPYAAGHRRGVKHFCPPSKPMLRCGIGQASSPSHSGSCAECWSITQNRARGSNAMASHRCRRPRTSPSWHWMTPWRDWRSSNLGTCLHKSLNYISSAA